MMAVALFLILLTLGHKVSSWDNGWDSDLYRRCPSGQAVSRIESEHSNYHEDRRWSISCRPAASFNHCYWSGWVNNFDQDIDFSCRDHYVIAGMRSYHSNHHEDRRWEYLCCLSPQLATSNCRWGWWVNDWDARLWWGLRRGYYLTGVGSFHNNDKEDRIWSFRYCKGGAPTASTGPVSWCGVPDIKPRISGYTSRIVGGQNARSGSWPWQVSIQTTSGHHSCGGSLINKYWVVTAAHCEVIAGRHHVILGEHDLKSSREPIQTISISKRIPHPNYNPNLKTTDPYWSDYDVALLRLSPRSRDTVRVSPVCLSPSYLYLPSRTRCVATGWGLTYVYFQTYPRILQQVVLPLLSNAQCKQYWGNDAITDNMICAGANGANGANGATTCKGDSGGPLVCERGGVWTLVGITSFGQKTCSGYIPAVFARVSKLRSWIDNTMRSN